MARQLIDSLASDFEPDKYRDEYRDRVLEMIERKAEGEEITIEAPSEEPEEVPDLMAALEASIASSKKQSKPAKKSRERATAPARPRRRRPQRRSSCRRTVVEVEGRKLSLTNLDKVLYPVPGFTKGQVIDYYTRVAPYVLPHLRGRPLTLKRYPNGVERRALLREAVPLAPARVGAVGRDPGQPQDDRLLPVRRPARRWSGWPTWPTWSCTRRCRRPRRSSTRPRWPSTSTPASRRGSWSAARWRCCCASCSTSWAWSASPRPRARRACRSTCRSTARPTYDRTKPLVPGAGPPPGGQHPKLVVSTQKKELRKGKVLIDWSQNDEHKTTVCVYSLRARERPTVSTPLTWDEVEGAARARATWSSRRPTCSSAARSTATCSRRSPSWSRRCPSCSLRRGMVDWSLARQIARLAAGSEGPPTTAGDLVAQVDDALRRGRLATPACALAGQAPTPEVVDRTGWAEINLDSLARLLEPVAGRLDERLDAAGPLAGRAADGGRRDAGRRGGPGDGLRLPAGAGPVRAGAAGPRRAAAAAVRDAEPGEGRRATWRSTARASRAGSPPTRSRTSCSSARCPGCASTSASSSASTWRRWTCGSGAAAPAPCRGCPNPRKLVERFAEGGLAALVQTRTQRRLMSRLQATMAVIEGYSEHVMDAVAPSLVRRARGPARGHGAPPRQPLGARAGPQPAAGPRHEDAPVRAGQALLRRRGGRARHRGPQPGVGERPTPCPTSPSSSGPRPGPRAWQTPRSPPPRAAFRAICVTALPRGFTYSVFGGIVLLSLEVISL